MKKIISLLLVLVLCLAFAACKKGDANQNDTDAGAADAADPGVVTEPVSEYPDNINDGSVPTDDDKYRADLNQLALVESRINVAPVHAKIEKLDGKCRMDIYNDTDAPVKNVTVGFIGLTENGTLVTVASSMSVTAYVGGSKPSTDYVQSYTAKDEIAPQEYFEMSFATKGDAFDRVACIVMSYESNGEKIESDETEAWVKAVCYSDSRKQGTKETPKENETLYIINDIDALKAAAAEAFDIKLEESERHYNAVPDRIILNLTNNAESAVKNVELYIVGIRKDGSRVEIDQSENAISALRILYGADRVPINGIEVLTLETETEIAAAESIRTSVSCNFAAWSDYSVIVASYTTADGTEVKNPATAQWLSAATNGEVTQPAE